MKQLSTDTIKRLVALHGWSGTVLSILLYVIILTGAIVVFDNEIRAWSSGEAPGGGSLSTPIDERFRTVASDLDPGLFEEIFLTRQSGGTLRARFVGHLEGAEGGAHDVEEHWIAPDGTITRSLAGKEGSAALSGDGSVLSRFIVDLHVRLHVPQPWGLFLTGILGFVMLIAAVTGVLIHRHVIRDLFVATRPGDRIVSVRDRHTLAGVWGLPFAAVLAFTGAFLSFALSLGLPVVAMVAFGGDQQKAIATVIGEPPAENATPATMMDLDKVVALATQRSGTVPSLIVLSNFGRADAGIRTFHPLEQGNLTGPTLEFDPFSGAFIGEVQTVGTVPSAGSVAVDLMAPLHFGNFAGLLSKAIWAGLGAAMTFTVVSGMQLWLRRRADNRVWARCQTALVATAWGLPLAMVASAYGFLLAYGAGWGTVFGWTAGGFVVVALGLILAAVRWPDVDRFGTASRTALAIALAALPLMRLATGGPGWASSLEDGNPAVFGGDLACILTAGLLMHVWLRGLFIGLRGGVAAP